MAIKTRQTTATGVTNVDAPLTNAEVDNNFVELQQNKVSTSGDTMTGDLSFGDNDKAIFGAGSDLEIYHDGSNSIIKDAGTGTVKLLASDFELLSNNGNYLSLKNDMNGLGGINLYYSGNQKLSTVGTGIHVTGHISVSGFVDGVDIAGSIDQAVLTTSSPTFGGMTLNGTLALGSNVINDVEDIYLRDRIFHDGDTDTYFQFHAANQARIVCAGAEVMEWGANYAKLSDNDYMYFGSGADFRIYHNGTDNYLRNYNHANGDIYIQGEDTSGVNHTIAGFISANAAPYVDLYYDGSIVFNTVSGGVNVNGNINAVDNIYLASTMYHEGDTDTKIAFGTNVVSISAGGSQEITVTATGVQLGDTGNGYFQPVSGNYGSIQIDGGAHGGYEGYNIGGRAAFLHDNGTETGISDDVNNAWMVRLVHGGAAELYYAGTSKLDTLSNGVSINGNLYTDGSNAEDYDALSGTTPTCNVDNGGAFSLTMTGNTTFTFSGADSGWSQGFVLQLTGNGGTVTWPTSVDWAGGTAPDAPASGETDLLVFWTRDGGTTWYGMLAIDAAA